MNDPTHLNVKRSALNVERSASIDADNPWPGLASFTEEQSGQFFGRDAEVKTLARRVQGDPLTVLFGQSGLGKSSLLQAGVFPRLRSVDFCPVYLRLDHGPGAPAPSEQVQQLMLAGTARSGQWTKPEAFRSGESLWEFFHHRDNRLVSPGGIALSPVLVFDQFEELFTLGAAHSAGSGSASGGAERARAVAFMAELAELVENRPPEALVARLEGSSADLDAFDFGRADYRVVISLREDFLPHLEGLKTIMPTLMDNRMRLTRMNGVQALEAVVKPGAGLVTEEVGRAIVEFVAGARGGSTERLAELDVEPPLLSVICRELNERRRALGQEQITADLVSGNRREILNDFYERSVTDLPEGMRRFVEDKLLTKSGFRDNLALESALEEPGVTRPLIDTLVARRLLRIEDRIGVQRMELTHDVLADVVRASRDARQQRLIVVAAQRHTRRLRWAVVGLVAAVVALSVGAVFGIRAQRQATAQASRADLLLGSRLLDEGNLTNGLAYLVSAARKDPANHLLAPRILTTLTAHNFSLPVGAPLALPSPGLSSEYAADGRRIYVQREDDIVVVIDAVNWRIERELSFDRKVRRGGIALAEKNSAVFAVLLIDNTILVCDAATGRPRFAPITPPDQIVGRPPLFTFSPDGRWLAATSLTSVSLWDALTGELRATVPNAGSGRYFAFSPDSRRLVTTHGARVTQMWAVPDGSPVGRPIESGAVQWAGYPRFSADGRRLLVLNQNGALICDAETGALVRSPQTLDPFWWDALLTPDGQALVLIKANTVTILDLSTGRPIFPPLTHGGPIRAANFSGDGKILFTNSVDGLFRLWDLKSGKLLAEPTFKQDQFAPAALSPDGNTVAVFSGSGPVYRLRRGPGAAAPLVFPRDATVNMVNWAATTPSRLFWLTPTKAKLFDVASGREAEGGFTLPQPIFGNSRSIRSIYGGTVGAGLKLALRTTRAGEGPAWHGWTVGERGIAHDVLLDDVPDDVTLFRLNPTGNLAAANGTGRSGNSVGIWNLQTGRRVATFNSATPVLLPIVSEDEKRVAFRTNDQGTEVVHVGDIASGKELFVVQLSGKAAINNFRFTPDGARLLTGDDWGGVHIWDAATGKLVQSTQAHRAVVSRFDFSADGTYFASTSQDGSVQVWETATGAAVGPPLVQTGNAQRSDFSPDNSRIVTPSVSGTARVWDVRSGQPLTGLLDHEADSVGVVAFSPDGRFFETHGTGPAGQQAIRVWAAPPDGRGARTPNWLLQLATICAGQRLTDDGKFVSAVEEVARIDEVRRELAALPDDAPYVEWGRWFLSDSPARPIAPGFTITPAEAEKLREEMAQAAAAIATTPSAP